MTLADSTMEKINLASKIPFMALAAAPRICPHRKVGVGSQGWKNMNLRPSGKAHRRMIYWVVN